MKHTKQHRQWVQREWWWLSYLIVFACSFGILLTLQAAPTFADPDSYYHAKIAVLMRDHGIVRDFPWLDQTVLGRDFTDQHFLYHVLLVPFVTIFPPLLGLKLATVMFGALLATTMYWMMRQFGVRGGLIYIAILLFIRPFMFRISLAKAPSTSLIVLLLGLTWVFKYHYKRAAALAFFYVWYYGGFALFGVATAMYGGVSFLYNRLHTRTHSNRYVQKIFALVGRHARRPHRWSSNWLILFAVAAGTIVGIVINPYFPQNLSFYYHQLVNIGIINFQSVIGVGAEWYPYGFTELVANGAFASILVIAGLSAIVFGWKKQTRVSLTMFLLTAFFFVLTLKSRRYVEYYIPFAVLASAIAISDATKDVSWKSLWRWVMVNLFPQPWAKGIAVFLGLYILFGFGYIAGRDFRNNQSDLRGGYPIGKFSAAATWLQNHTPPGSRVLHSDWDEFPVLFYYNSHNRYMSGLDPTFFYKADPVKYMKYVDITVGRYDGNLRQAMRELDATYLFVSARHDKMAALIARDGQYVRVYKDDEASVYALPDTIRP